MLLLDHEATGLHLGIVEDPGGEVRIGDLTRHASAIQSVEQIAKAPLPEAQFEEGRQLAPMRRPGRGVSESGIVGEGTLPEDFEHSGPVLVAEGGQAQPPIGRLVKAIEGVKSQLHPVQVRTGQSLAVGFERGHRGDQQARVQNGGVDGLCFTRDCAMVESLNDADGREEAVAGVTEGGETPKGLPALAATAVLEGHSGQ